MSFFFNIITHPFQHSKDTQHLKEQKNPLVTTTTKVTDPYEDEASALLYQLGLNNKEHVFCEWVRSINQATVFIDRFATQSPQSGLQAGNKNKVR